MPKRDQITYFLRNCIGIVCSYFTFFQTAVCTASQPHTERKIPGTANSRQRAGGIQKETEREKVKERERDLL